MGLQDTIKEIKEQLAEEEKVENTESAEEIVEDPKEEISEEKKEEKEAPEEKEEVNESPDQLAFQRLRRTAAAAEKRAKELEEEVLALKSKPAQVNETSESPAELTPELQEMVQTHRMSQAEKEFQSLEKKFRGSNPEYDAVASAYGNAIAQSFKIQNPRMGNNEIAEKTKETILKKAANYLNQGFDPIEEIFHEAKELGFTAKKEVKADTKEEEIKPDMKKVAANRAKSTGMASSSGKSEGILTKQAAADLSTVEWKKLPNAEKRRLLSL